MERLDRMAPLFEETLRVYRDLGKSSNDVFPDLRRTNEEIQATARSWGKLGERVDVLLQTNQDKIVKTLDNLSESVVRVSNVLNEENQRNLATTLRNVSTSSSNFESISKNADALLKESQKTVIRFNDTLGRTGEILADLQELLKTMNQSDGAFRRLIADPSLYNNLNSVVDAIARDMPRIEQILKDVEVFADKIARHPESLGVRGAVSPSSGLKESPSRPLYVPRSPE
jgi:ABC-type transporter Mla subunit MlaD